MQFASDTDLAAALAAPDIIVDGRLEFDWNRNGLYDHDWSDLSFLATRVSVDMGPITGDLPDQVNTLTGFSSAELEATLGGSKFGDPDLDAAWNASLRQFGLAAEQLFSPYWTASPLYGLRIVGTPVRYSRVVETATGDRTIRQFTGVVRWFDISRSGGRVEITGSDIADFSGAVTLPLWARMDSGYLTTWRPISSTWVVEEALRQGGRPTGPRARSDAVAYFTCNGSFLPSIGHWADSYQLPFRRHFLPYTLDEPWQDGKYGIAPKRNGNSSGLHGSPARNGATAATASTVVVPNAGAGQSGVSVGIAFWAYSNGSGTGYDGTHSCSVLMSIEDYPRNEYNDGQYHDGGALQLEVYENGTADLLVKEDFDTVGLRTWQWNRTVPTAAGWHYYAAHFHFTDTSVTTSLRIDDVVVALSAVSVSAGGFRYSYPITGSRTNLVQIAPNIPSQHIQIYAAPTSTFAYQTGQGNAPTNEGAPLAKVYGTLSELLYIPDVNRANAWDVLKNVAAGELGVLHTDEWGTLHYLAHSAMRNHTQADLDNATTISDDRLMDMLINPSIDVYKNTVSISYGLRQGIRGIIYQAKEPWDHYAYGGQTVGYDLEVTDTIAIRCAGMNRITNGVNPTQGADIYTGTVGAQAWGGLPQEPTAMSNPTVGSLWSAGAVSLEDPRKFQLQLYSPDQALVLCYAGGNQAAVAVAGIKYSELVVKRETFSDAADVAANGVRMIELQDHPWRQVRETAVAVANSILADTVNPVPVIENVRIHTDPRMQLRDIVKLTSEDGITGALYAQVIGIRREDTASGGSVDDVTLRVIRTPGEWVLGDPDLSILGSTTILGDGA